MSILLWVLAAVLVVIGLAGILLPALPGTILIFAGLLLAAWADGFTRVGAGTLVVVGLIGAASYGVDFVAAALGVKRLGASSRAMAGAALGALLGLLFGLPGLILGPFAGAVLGELSAHRDLARRACGHRRMDWFCHWRGGEGRARVYDARDLPRRTVPLTAGLNF